MESRRSSLGLVLASVYDGGDRVSRQLVLQMFFFPVSSLICGSLLDSVYGIEQ